MMSDVKCGILILVLSCLIISCQAESVEYQPLFICAKRMDYPYGIVAHISRKGPDYEYDSIDKSLDLIKSVGISNIRVDFDWYTFRKGFVRDSVSFERFDKMMSSVSERNLNILGIISNTNVGQFSVWRNHTDLLVKHFKKRVYNWEIVNEADLFAKRNQDYKPEEYIRILKGGYKIIKSNDKRTRVLYTGTSDIGYNFFDETLSKGAASYFDIMNVHTYTGQMEPEVLISYYEFLKKKMDKYVVEKPVWMTETGYPTSGENSVSMYTQALRLPRAFLISFALGVDKIFWYNFKASELSENDRECHFGIMHNDYTPKPAYYAYKTLVQMCPHRSTRPVLSYKDGVYLAKWKRKDKKSIVALWMSKGSKGFTITSSKKYEVFDINGEPINRKDDVVIVSQSIIYIVGDKDIMVL